MRALTGVTDQTAGGGGTAAARLFNLPTLPHWRPHTVTQRLLNAAT